MSMQDFNEVVSMINRAKDFNTVSLSQLTKQSIIESPLFIQDLLLDEPIRDSVIKTLYNLYISQILVAMQMTQIVQSGRTVKDILGTVSSSSYSDTYGEKGVGAAAEFLDSSKLLAGFENLGKPAIEVSQVFDPTKIGPIPSGRLIELKIASGTVGKDGKNDISILVNVMLNPRSVPTSVVEQLVNTGFNQNIADRWLKAKSGEIRFFKDFLLNLDQLEKRAEALKADKDNVLKDIFAHQNKASVRQALRLAFQNTKSYNLANGILMLKEDDFLRFAKTNNMNFDRFSDRQTFFMKTFSLFIVLVDTRHSMVTIYTNGIANGAEYTYSEIKSNAQTEKVDIATMMEFLSKNQMPKF